MIARDLSWRSLSVSKALSKILPFSYSRYSVLFFFFLLPPPFIHTKNTAPNGAVFFPGCLQFIPKLYAIGNSGSKWAAWEQPNEYKQ